MRQLCRAAFDKGDALYLRDETERARHAELELRDAQLSKFARLREALDDGGGGDAVGRDLEREGVGPPPLAGARAGNGTAVAPGGGPAAKRPRTVSRCVFAEMPGSQQCIMVALLFGLRLILRGHNSWLTARHRRELLSNAQPCEGA